MKRLGLESRIRTKFLPPDVSLPAVGRGAVGLSVVFTTRTQAARTVESTANRAARNGGTREEHPPEGGCQVPIGSYAEIINGEIWPRALVGAPDGSVMVRGERRGSPGAGG